MTRKRIARKPWENWEEEYLIKNYPQVNYDDMMETLTNRSREAIVYKVYCLKKEGKIAQVAQRKIVRWTEEDKQKVLEEFKTTGKKKLAKELNRTPSSVEGMYFKLVEQEKLAKAREERKKYGKVDDRDYGIGKTLKNTNYILGKTYIVKSSNKKAPDPFKGKLIQQTQDYIVLEGRYRQCYMKKDFLIGDYEIKEVRN